MRRSAIILLTVLALGLPRFAQAQAANPIDDDYGPPPYNDVEDGQALRIAGYILAPFGYALEWGLTRPLHYVATDTAAAPVLSGDTDIRYFGETTNADRLPPNTFTPFHVPPNPNAIEPDSAPLAYQPRSNTLPPVRTYESTRTPPASESGSQPALR